MAKTNSGLVAYCKAQVGLPYWYGTFGQKATKALYESKKKQYPNYYKASDFPSQYGKRVHDCAGLIKGYLWSATPTSTPKYNAKQDYGANGFYTSAKIKGSISSFNKVDGQLVFKGTDSKKTHVGVYVGGNVIEAKGHAYGVIISKFNSSWTHWAQCQLIEDDTSKPQPAPEPSPSPSPSPAPSPKPNKVQPAKSFNTAYNGTWKVTASSLNMRYGAGTEWGIITCIPNGKKVRCYGYYTNDWLCVVYGSYTGYCCKKYLVKC